MSELVGNPKDRFSHVATQMITDKTGLLQVLELLLCDIHERIQSVFQTCVFDVNR